MTVHKFIPLPKQPGYSKKEAHQRAAEYYELLNQRRTVRDFSSESVPVEIIEDCIRAAGTAPSGANLQPWHFCVVTDAEKKKKIRHAAEAEEHEFYTHRASQEWLDALAPLGTNEHKQFLEKAPVLIGIFMQKFGTLPDGRKCKHYYSQESVGLATGVLISAIHNAGLVSLTHTPSPMNFLNKIMGRPENEKPFLLLVVGYPDPDAKIPNIHRKSLGEISSYL